jgi:V-type H+-transporting ATPase subunit A
MLRCMIGFYEAATRAVEGSGGALTWGRVRDGMGDVIYKLSSMKFEDPADGEGVIVARFEALMKEIEERFAAIE